MSEQPRPACRYSAPRRGGGSTVVVHVQALERFLSARCNRWRSAGFPVAGAWRAEKFKAWLENGTPTYCEKRERK